MSLISFPKTFQDGTVLFGADLENLKAAITAAVNGFLDNSNVAAAANIDLSKLGDYSTNATEMQVQTSPGGVGSESLATDVRGELARIRFVLAQLVGGTFWYSKAVAATGPAIGPGFTTGDVKLTMKTTADAGWVMLSDGTIGDASSNATARANADTQDLFRVLWATYSNTDCPIFDSGGVASSRGGSADADYAAHKALRLPLAAARLLGIAGTPAAANVTESITGTMGILGTTPVAGLSTTQTFLDPNNSSKTATDYVGARIRFTSGALAGIEHTISAYDQNLHLVTHGAFGSPAAQGVSYVIYEEAAQTTFAYLPHDQFSAKDSAYNGYTIETTGGTGSGQVRTISAYDGSQRRVTVSVAWSSQPDYTTTFKIYKTIPTRANAAQLGSDVTFPVTDTMAEHNHDMPGNQHYASSGSNAMSHADTTTLAQGSGNADRVINPAFAGAGSTISRYAPSVFFPAMVKL